MIVFYIIGPAGAGKTTLTHVLSEYIKSNNPEITVITINLDPAVQNLPYTPDIDIQDYITLQQVIEETGLGPNGGMIEATDRMINYIDEIKYEISQYNNPEVILVDTPGQMELFSFRKSGPMIANALGFGEITRGILFCYDAGLARKPSGLMSMLLLGASVQFRFSNLPMISLLTKSDIISEEQIEKIQDWMENPYSFQDAAVAQEKGMLREFTATLARSFNELGIFQRLLPVSAKQAFNIDSVWGMIQQTMNDESSTFT